MSLLKILCDILAADGWRFNLDQRNEIVQLEVRGVNANLRLIVYVDEEQESFLCNTHTNLKIPYAKRLQICEFMNRVNYEMVNGNFEMDMEDGEIRYRTSLDLSGAEASKDQILNLIWNGAQSFDTFFPGMMELLYENCTPEQAVSLCMVENNV